MTVQIRGTNATPLNQVLVYGGTASVAARGETAVLLTARQTGGSLLLGNNVTWTNLSGTVTVMAD